MPNEHEYQRECDNIDEWNSEIADKANNIRQDEKARMRKQDNTLLQVKGHALQSNSNKRDMGSPADTHSKQIANRSEDGRS